MATVRSDQSPSLSDHDLGLSPLNRNLVPQKSSTPSRRSHRPRTRSLVLKAASNANCISPRKKHRRGSSRESSPIIDLTADEENPIEIPAVLDDESPLRFTKRHSNSMAIPSSSSKPQSSISPNTHAGLDLSPIKRFETTEAMAPPVKPYLFSSPVKQRKTVTFSDDILPSSPAKLVETPRKSILKNPVSATSDLSPLDPNNTALWAAPAPSILRLIDTSSPLHSPTNPDFWQPGTIIQLEPKSKDLPHLVDGCMDVVQLDSFTKKFEVYATLNQVCKFNDHAVLAELFLGLPRSWLDSVEKSTSYKPRSNPAYIEVICRCLQRDILHTESVMLEKPDFARNDPFQSRVLSQALRLAANLLAIPTINTSIPIASIQWIYDHACDVIVSPVISKSLVLPYLAVIKDCHFGSKMRRAIFENGPSPLLEKMLFALLNIRSFPSSSLVNEKFVMLKNLIQHFPGLMAKNFHHWYTTLVINLCDTSFPLYAKVISMGVIALLEAARNYLDNTDICFAGRTFLESPLPDSQRSFTSDKLLSTNTQHSTRTIDFVIDSLTELIKSGFHKPALDIWVGVTLLCGRFDRGMENWRYLARWLLVHKMCFNESDVLAKVTAISSWKVIIYKMCCFELRDTNALAVACSETSRGGEAATPESGKKEDPLRSKTKLLIHIFVNITSFQNQQEIIDALHYAFMTILYNILNYQPRATSKYLHYFWDKIIQPVLINFYFKKGASNAHMHKLGFSIIDRLIRLNSSSEKPFSPVRCLSNETVSLSEINALNPKWVFVRFDRIMQILAVSFKLEDIDMESKLTLLNTFFNDLKFITKKEAHPSDTTFDIIDNLPLTLEILCKQNKVSYDSLFKLVVNLNDTFGAQNMIYDAAVESSYEILLKNTIQYFTSSQLHAIVTMIHGAVGEKNSLAFLYQLLRLNQIHHRGDVDSYIGDWLNSKKFSKLTNSEMVTAGRMFELLQQDYATISKKLIQHIVLLKADEFEKMVERLGIVKWSRPIFKFFIGLMHNAPYDHLKQTTINLIMAKWEREPCFLDILEYLVDNHYESEIIASVDEVAKKLALLEWDDQQKGILLVRTFFSRIQDPSTLDDLLAQFMDHMSTFSEHLDASWKQLPKTQARLAEAGLAEKSFDDSTETAMLIKQNELENLLENEIGSQQEREYGPVATGNEIVVDTKEVLQKASEEEVLEVNEEDKKAVGGEEVISSSEQEDSRDTTMNSMSQESDAGEESNNTKMVAQPSPPRRKTRRMAAKERENSLRHQQVVEISSDEPNQEAGEPEKKAQKGQKHHKDESPERREESDGIDDSIESLEMSSKTPASIPDPRKRNGEPIIVQGAKRQKSWQDRKQVSDSDDSAKRAAMTKTEAVDSRTQIVDSSTEGEKQSGLSSQSSSSCNSNSGSNRENKKDNDSFVNISCGSINFQGESSEATKPNEKDNGAEPPLPMVDEKPELEEPPRSAGQSFYEKLVGIIGTADDTEVQRLTPQERFHVETMMMRFMLKMRGG